jgi:hypothetical protein
VKVIQNFTCVLLERSRFLDLYSIAIRNDANRYQNYQGDGETCGNGAFSGPSHESAFIRETSQFQIANHDNGREAPGTQDYWGTYFSANPVQTQPCRLHPNVGSTYEVKAMPNEKTPGSPQVTPHEPEHKGSRRDPEERPAPKPDEVKDKMLDKTLADSFPTSDPPSSIPDPSEDDSFAA